MDDWTLEQCVEEELLKQRDGRLEKIKELLSTAQDTTLVLGSGICIPAGLPGWGQMLAELWGELINVNATIDEEIFETADKKLVAELKRERPGLNAKGLKEAVAERLAGENILRHIGYRETAEYFGSVIHSEIPSAPFLYAATRGRQEEMDGLHMVSMVRQVLKGHFDEKANLKLIDDLADWARGSLLSGGQKGAARVITYNYDDLFEWRLAEGRGSAIRESVVSLRSEDSLPVGIFGMEIYHVHGRIHIAPCRPFGADSTALVLTESSYLEAEKNSYDWLNSLQAFYLLRSRCIFVGFSAQDYNFKRILKNLKCDSENAARHFMFVCTDDLVEELLSHGKGSHTEDPIFRLLLNRILASQEIYWRKYGIVPVWTTKNEIGDLVEELSRDCFSN